MTDDEQRGARLSVPEWLFGEDDDFLDADERERILEKSRASNPHRAMPVLVSTPVRPGPLCGMLHAATGGDEPQGGVDDRR